MQELGGIYVGHHVIGIQPSWHSSFSTHCNLLPEEILGMWLCQHACIPGHGLVYLILAPDTVLPLFSSMQPALSRAAGKSEYSSITLKELPIKSLPELRPGTSS